MENTLSVPSDGTSPPSAVAKAMADKKGERRKTPYGAFALDFPLIFETEHDKVEKDMEILKSLRNKI